MGQNSSRGHSVPVINGRYQKPGAGYRAKDVVAGDSSFELEIAGAYEEGIVNSIRRKFILDDDSVNLKDVFEISDKTESVAESFISKKEPEIIEGAVKIGNALLKYDSEKYKADITTEVYTAHNAVDKITVYETNIIPVDYSERVFEFRIEFE